MLTNLFFFYYFNTISYVETAHSKDGTVVQLNVRGKLIPAQVCTVYFSALMRSCLRVI